MTYSDDRGFFHDNPDRCHYCRLATTEEIEQLAAAAGDSLIPLDGDRFVYSLIRLDRESGRLDLLIVVLDARQEMGEAECRQAWHEAEAMGGRPQ